MTDERGAVETEEGRDTPPPVAPPATNPVFESALGKLVFAILVGAVVVLLVLFVMACLGAFGPPYRIDADADFFVPQQPRLYWPWDAFVWLIANGGVLGQLATGAGAVFAVGIKVIARDTRREWLALTILGLCLSGMALSVLLMWQLSNDTALNALRSPTGLDDDKFGIRLYAGLTAIAGWFLVFLARQVGVSAGQDVIKHVWQRWTGGA